MTAPHDPITPYDTNKTVNKTRPVIGDIRRVRGGCVIQTNVRAGTDLAKGIIDSIGR